MTDQMEAFEKSEKLKPDKREVDEAEANMRQAERAHKGEDNLTVGELGEGLTTRIVSDRYNLTPEAWFDGKKHGIDVICRDSKGELWVVESKLTKASLNQALGKEMTPEWIDKKAQLMQTKGSELNTPGNEKLGAEIQTIGPEKVHRMVVLTHPSTLEARIYQDQPDGTLDLTECFSVMDYDQPIPEGW